MPDSVFFLADQPEQPHQLMGVGCAGIEPDPYANQVSAPTDMAQSHRKLL